jgi:hypothetical protein
MYEHGDNALAVMVEDAIDGPERELDAFLVSNELWGGAGSIADQAGLMGVGRRTAGRRESNEFLSGMGRPLHSD